MTHVIMTYHMTHVIMTVITWPM